MARNKKKKKKQIKNQKKITILEKLMEYETLYTILFVLFFMILFCVIGYYSLRVHNKSIFSPFQSHRDDRLFSVSSSIVTLTEESSLADNIGLNYHKYVILIDNHQKKEVKYQLLFEEDNDIKKTCGCSFSDFQYSMIHYSIDQKNSLVFQNDKMVLLEDSILSNEKKELVISMWLSEELRNIGKFHIHGHFTVKEV